MWRYSWYNVFWFGSLELECVFVIWNMWYVQRLNEKSIQQTKQNRKVEGNWKGNKTKRLLSGVLPFHRHQHHHHQKIYILLYFVLHNIRSLRATFFRDLTQPGFTMSWPNPSLKLRPNPTRPDSKIKFQTRPTNQNLALHQISS